MYVYMEISETLEAGVYMYVGLLGVFACVCALHLSLFFFLFHFFLPIL